MIIQSGSAFFTVVKGSDFKMSVISLKFVAMFMLQKYSNYGLLLFLLTEISSLEVKFGSFQMRCSSQSENPSLMKGSVLFFKENLLFPFFERWGLGFVKVTEFEVSSLYSLRLHFERGYFA